MYFSEKIAPMRLMLPLKRNTVNRRIPDFLVVCRDQYPINSKKVGLYVDCKNKEKPK